MKPAELATNEDFLAFYVRLHTNDWKLVPCLEAERDLRDHPSYGDWCSINTSLVAVFAVVTGQDDVFTTFGASGHIAGALYGITFDFPVKIKYKSLSLHPENKYRRLYLEPVYEWARNRKPHPDKVKFETLIAEDRFDEAKELFKATFF